MTTERYRVQLYWPGRPDPLLRMAEQLATFFEQLRTGHPLLDGFAPLDRREPLLLKVPRPDELARVLTANAVNWQVGKQNVVSYTPRFALRQARSAPAEFQLTVGIPELPLPPDVVSNRLEFYVRPDDRAFANAEVLVAVLRAGVAAFSPRWGYIGTETTPQAPRPLFSAPGPVIGWISYFDKTFSLADVRLPEIAARLPLGDQGVAIVSQRDLFDPGRRAHLDALRGIETLLQQAGVVS
jgi:hypothetical protein